MSSYTLPGGKYYRAEAGEEQITTWCRILLTKEGGPTENAKQKGLKGSFLTVYYVISKLWQQENQECNVFSNSKFQD